MCLATPMELVRIENEWGFIEHGGHEHKISLSLIDKPKKGDWLLAHGDLAVSRIPKDEALEIIKLLKKAGQTC